MWTELRKMRLRSAWRIGVDKKNITSARFSSNRTETADEIVWKNPKSPIPDMTIEGFRFRAKLPNEPGCVLFFKTLNQCEEGDDNYIDLPEPGININDEDFAEKFMSFMTATATPSPYLILYKSELPQYPWEWDTQEIRDAAIAEAN